MRIQQPPAVAMRGVRTIAGLGIGLVLCLTAAAQEAPQEPQLRLSPNGPTSFVTALQFSPDGNLLYVGGIDKVVHVWARNAETGRFEFLQQTAYRVPIGPGLSGAINTIAVSPDGQWLAVGGSSVIRGTAGFRETGVVLKAQGTLTQTMREDQGTIHLFNTRRQQVKTLRGHLGPVFSLRFVPGEGTPLLVSAAQEWRAEQSKYVGAVRLWNVDTARYLKGAYLEELRDRPGLAARRRGKGPLEVDVVVAWGDGQLRHWQPETNRLLLRKVDGYNTALDQSGDGSLVASGSFGSRSGQLRLWRHDGPQLPAAPSHQQAIPSEQGDYLFPRALAVLGGAGANQRLAAVVRRTRPPADVRGWQLRLYGLANGRVGPLQASVNLSQYGNMARTPVMVGDSEGKYLAVSGGADQGVYLYQVDQLLQNKPEAAQVLRSAGLVYHAVAFGKQGDRGGLLLHRRAAGSNPAAPDAVLDLQTGKFADVGRQPWSLSALPAGWQVNSRATRDGGIVEVRGPGVSRSIALGEDHELSDVALLPPIDKQPPLLAVASHRRGMPRLALYRADTGAMFRLLVGHTERVLSIAFSPDGRLLASTSNDQTVRLWSLTTVDQVLDRRGGLEGVTLDTVDKQVVVAEVESNAAGGNLQRGDRLSGYYHEDKLVPLTSSRTAYDLFWIAAPGQTIRFRRERGPADVSLTVSQGVDDRKPLCSLFVSASDNALPDWIAWSPLGPYETSAPALERFLGWHFNPVGEQREVRFGKLAEYRDEYQRPGMLKELLENGTLKQRIEPPLERPVIVPKIRDSQLVDGEGAGERPLLRTTDTLLQVLVGLPSARVSGVELEFDGKRLGAMELDPEQFWNYPLQDAPWTRGVHRLRTVVLTKEARPQQFDELVEVRYQPPAPRLQFAQPLPESVDKAAFRLQADVQPQAGAGPVRVELTHWHDGKVLDRYEVTVDKQQQVTRDLNLQPGRNEIHLSAANRDALEGYERHEQTVKNWTPFLKMEEQTTSPQVTLRTRGIDDDDREHPELQAPEVPLLVKRKTVKLEGSIAFKGVLPEVEIDWIDRDNGKRIRLPAKTRREGDRVHFEVSPPAAQPGDNPLEIRLKRASQSVRFQAKVVFQPKLPGVHIAEPRNLQERIEGRDSAEIEVRGELELPDEPFPFEAFLLVNGQQQPKPLEVARDRIASQVTLQPGANQFRFRLVNRLGDETLSAPVVVFFRQPPTIEAVDVAPQGKLPYADLTIRGRSAQAPTRVEVNGQPLAANEIRFDKAAETWQAVASGLALQSGKNRFQVVAWNPDGQSLKAGDATIDYSEPDVEKPELVLLSPRDSHSTNESTETVKFRIRSASPLVSITVHRNQEMVFESNNPLPTLRAGDGGVWEKEVLISLQAGLNHLRVTAQNAGGEVQQAVVLNVPHTPVRLEVVGIAPANSPQQVTVPDAVSAGVVRFTHRADDSRVLILGRVRWSDPDARKLQDPRARVRMYVNGFQQPAVRLAPAAIGKAYREFQGLVYLSRETDNRVEIMLPGIEKDASSPLELSVDCERPTKSQRMHLMVIGVGVAADRRTVIENRALAAIQAKRDPAVPARFSTPAFPTGTIYRPMLGDRITRGRILSSLIAINQSIEAQQREGYSNDVVLIYYEGGQVASTETGFVLSTTSPDNPLTSETLREPDRLQDYCIDTQLLTMILGQTRGAQVLMLDVVQDADSAKSNNKLGLEDCRAAVLRYAWVKGQPPLAPARLINALQAALPRHGELEEVDRQLERNARESQKVDYSRHLPVHLQKLLLAQPSGG